MAYSEAQGKASMKYAQANIDRLTIDTPKGTKERWKAAAVAAGARSVTAYVIQAVEERIRSEAEHDQG